MEEQVEPQNKKALTDLCGTAKGMLDELALAGQKDESTGDVKVESPPYQDLLRASADMRLSEK